MVRFRAVLLRLNSLVSILSLMNQPFLMAPNLEVTMGIKPDKTFWMDLAAHQCKLLENGCLNRQTA